MRSKILLTFTLFVCAAALSAPSASARLESGPPAPTPPPIEGVGGPINGVTAVTTGYYHGCARLESSQVQCWGYNGSGQLGVGQSSDDLSTALFVRNRAGTGRLGNVRSVAAGSHHTCAVLTNTQVRCWGANIDGQLGNGGTEASSLPVPVLNPGGTRPLDSVTQIAAGGSTTCARLESGQVRCWGYNGHGQLGNGTTDGRVRPAVVKAVAGAGALTGVTQVEVGINSTCARLSTGQARCWGQNTQGQLGDGSNAQRTRPVVVRNVAGGGPLTGVRRISTGGAHTCAVLGNATARCWGENDDRQLGDGTEYDRFLPVVVANVNGTGPLAGVGSIDAGQSHSCARLASGGARCWGQNTYNQIGHGIEQGPDVPLPKAVRNQLGTADLSGVTQLHTGESHTCVRLANGQARCWGYGEHGGLGDGDDLNRPLPVPVVVTSI